MGVYKKEGVITQDLNKTQHCQINEQMFKTHKPLLGSQIINWICVKVVLVDFVIKISWVMIRDYFFSSIILGSQIINYEF